MTMKYLVYVALAFMAGLLFFPASGSTRIRNLPILIALLCFLGAVVLWRQFRYLRLMIKARKSLKKQGISNVRSTFLPWGSRFHGSYRLLFPYKNETVQIILFIRKRKYIRYHFETEDRLECYRTNRVVFNNIKAKGATVSNMTETKLVGKQRLFWNSSATVRIVLFDKLPPLVSDSKKKEAIGVGERMESADAYLFDWSLFCKHTEK